MMIPNMFGIAYLIGTAGLGILLLIVANKFLDNSSKQKPVRLFGGVLTGLAVLGGLMYVAIGTDVIRIVHKGNETVADKFFMIGGSKVTLAGKDFELTSKRSGTWIINDTADLLATVEVKEYGAAASDPPEEILVQPNSAGLFNGNVNNIGPGNSLPGSVSSKSSSEIRTWLSWTPTAGLGDLDSLQNELDNFKKQ